MATQNSSRPQPAIDRSQSGARGVGLALLPAVAVAGAVWLLLLGRGSAEPYVLALLAVLAAAGVFSLLAFACGVLRFSGGARADPLLKAAVEEAGEGLLITDARNRVLYANAAYRALVGDGCEARPIEQAFTGSPEMSEAVYRLLVAAREGRKAQEEVRVAGGEAAARWLRLSVQPLAADVTRDRARQENAFQELQRAVDYLDHAPAGFFSLDANGAIVYLNATLAAWLEYDFSQVGAGGLKLADVAGEEAVAQLAALSAAPGEVKTATLDLDFRTRSGRALPVRLIHQVAFGADGAPGVSRTLVLARAHTEAADPQRAAGARFMRFFHHTPMAIATVDKSGKIARSNALFARLFEGLLPEGGDSILAVAAERDRAALESAIRRAAEGSDVAPVDAALSGKGERFARFYLSAVAEEERDGEAVIVYLLDTTEQRSLEAQFAQSQKMEAVGQLAGGIAHDFNNVLSAIMMATDFLLSAHRPTDPSFQDIMQIKQNANRAASLVRQLLAFSRRQTLRPQVLDLVEVLSDFTMLLRRLIGEKIKLEVVAGRDLWPVKVDLTQFQQVIVNLAVNARDAMPDGGKLTIRSANIGREESAGFSYKGMPSGDYVLVEVADTGTGIPEEIIDKIFEPFFSTKEVGKGTGLGLSTVYGIIKQTGGFIYPHSKVGEGTTFRIFLPRHQPGAAAEPSPALSEAAAFPAAEPAPPLAVDLTGQGTILLVEDEEGLRALNARGLASRGYTVIEAGNGVEAIAALERHDGKVDLVVSDVVMPEMDGPTLLRELRRRNPELKVIFVSGYAEEAFEKSLLAGEQFPFLAKPFSLKQLVAAVKETMAS